MQSFNIPTIDDINIALIPIQNSINEIKSQIDSVKPPTEYYRNKDLKQIFGFSDNTIISYRDGNIIPSTKIGEIFFYPVNEINEILKSNSNCYKLSKIVTTK